MPENKYRPAHLAPPNKDRGHSAKEKAPRAARSAKHEQKPEAEQNSVPAVPAIEEPIRERVAIVKAKPTERVADEEAAKAPEKRIQKKRGRGARNAAIIILCVFTLLVGGAYYAVNHYYSKLNFGFAAEDESGKKVEDTVTASSLEEETGRSYTGKKVTNILLVGVDNDYADGMDDRGNADGLIIMSINQDTKQIVLSSIMRDTRVTAPEGYKTKITLVYHDSGTQALIGAIESSFKIPIDGYALINYLSLIDVVDAVGGLDMELTKSEIYWMDPKIENLCKLTGKSYDENKLTVDQEGELHLNGLQTAAYLRIRYAGNGDFDRTTRARDVLMMLKDKALGMGIMELNSLANAVLPQITTDISMTTLLSMAMNAASYAKYDTVSIRLPADGTFTESQDGNAMIIADFDKNADYLYKAVYEGNIDN